MARPVDPELNEKRRSQILEAAATCFAERGFHKTTMQEIITASGISGGGLYRYFKSKDEIIKGIIDAEGIQYDRAINLLGESEDPVEALKEIACSLLRAFNDENFSKLFIEILSEISRKPELSSMVLMNERKYLAALVASLEKGKANGFIDPDIDVESTADLINATFNGVFYSNIVNPKNSLKDRVAPVHDMLHKVLRSEAGGFV